MDLELLEELLEEKEQEYLITKNFEQKKILYVEIEQLKEEIKNRKEK